MSSLMLWAWLALAAVPLPQTHAVSGTVVDPAGKPVKGATVWLTAFVRSMPTSKTWRRSRRTPRAGSRSMPRPAVATGLGYCRFGPMRRDRGSRSARRRTDRRTIKDRSA